MAAREENILNVPLSETLEGMHVLCDTGDTGEPYRVAASLFIAEATQAAKDAVANLDPKDVILKGFTALTAGKPAITANTTLLAAIRSLYAMVGSGKVKIVSDGADQTGMVCWNETSASGFVINVNEAAIYTRSQWTQASPDSVTDANWIAAVKTGGTKTPFAAAAQNPNMGDLPTNSSLKFVDNKTTILGMLKMLTAAANVGRLRIVSGNPATGASGKPELAFIVNIVQGANAETQGTNGLQIFHLTNDFLRVIPSSSIGMAWPTLQTLTDEDVIKKLNSTASGDWGGLGVKMNWNQSSIATVEITDFAVPGINVTKDGESFFIYASNPSHHPYNNDDSTSFVGIAVASPIFISGDQRLLYYMVLDTQKARFYTGYANMEDDSVTWSDGTQTRLGGAIQVTAFTEGALSSLVYDYKPGDFIPFYTGNVTASASNQFPESGVFNGFISMGSNEGDYFQIFAFKTGAGGKAYSGSCIGSTTTWTELGGGGGEQTVIWINANQNVFDVGLYPFTKLGEMFPIFIDTSATNNPSKEGYPCAGTVQCVGYQGPESWEAVFVVGSADEDQTPRGDYYKAHLSYDMGGSAWIELTTGSSGEIFPGWKLIVSSWSSAVGPSGTRGIIYFNQEIPITSKMLIEATIQSSPATTAAIKFPVPLTIAGINGTGQGILFEISSKYLGINSTPGSIKLICSSVITGANGMRGMNVVVQSDNLSDISDIIQIKGIYFKA
jgi:hypothetical protein